MDHLIEQCSDIAGAKPGRRKFQIVIIYENLVSAARALRACEFLRVEIGDAVSLEVNVWKMAILKDGDTRRLAATASSLADVVIVSASGLEEIPPAFRDWMESWTKIEGVPRAALFALFGEHIGDGAVSVATYLRHKTVLHGIDFFCHPPIDGGRIGHAESLQPALGAGLASREWRPGQERPKNAAPTAIDAIEEFAAGLRIRIGEPVASANPSAREEWKSEYTHQQLFV